MANAAKVVCIISGSSRGVSESIGETFFIDGGPGLITALNIIQDYATWRAGYLPQGLVIVGIRASLADTPRVSTLRKILIPGNAPGPQGRDVLTSGALVHTYAGGRRYQGSRTIRGLPDRLLTYTVQGAYNKAAGVDDFAAAFGNKCAELSLSQKSISREGGDTRISSIDSLDITDGVLTGFNSAEAAADGGFVVGKSILVTGCKGPGANSCNRVYRITANDMTAFDITPQIQLPEGILYIANSGSMGIRVPIYPIIEEARFVRFSSKRTAGAPFSRRSRRRRVKAS